MKRIDCRGIACPRPVIMTKKELESMGAGEIEVVVDNEAARENVSKFAKNFGADFVITEKDGNYHIIIKKQAGNEAIDEGETINPRGNGELVILVSKDTLGEGDDKLGAALLKSYMYALSECSDKPSTMLFLNGGVKLTTEGSEVLESLKLLENSGVIILSCGTCLDFYGLKDKLAIGSVTNMYTIVEKMNGAANTIKL